MDYNRLDDRENDWLAKELRLENVKLKHSDYCEAKQVKEEHESYHQDQIVSEKIVKTIKNKTKTPGKKRNVIQTILLIYIIWIVISIIMAIISIF